MLASPPRSPSSHVLFDEPTSPSSPRAHLPSSSLLSSASSPDRPQAPRQQRERAESQLSTTETHSTTQDPASTAPTSHHQGRSTLILGDEQVEEGKRVNMLEQEDIILSIDLCKFHAGDRLPTDPFWRPRWEMANIHVALWTGLAQVYRHAPLIENRKEDKLAFARFAAAVVAAIGTHHDVEEEVYFPSLELAISMAANLEQHSSFDEGLRALKFYLRACILDPSLLEATIVLDMVDSFAVELATHFADELNTLHPDILSLHFSTRELDKQGASLQKHIIKDYKRHLYTALPVLIINTPPGREWPVLSPLVRRILLPLVLGRKYKASWKYGKWPTQLKVFHSTSTSVAAPNLSKPLPVELPTSTNNNTLWTKPSVIISLSSFDASKPVRARVRSVSSKDVIGEWTAGVEKGGSVVAHHEGEEAAGGLLLAKVEEGRGVGEEAVVAEGEGHVETLGEEVVVVGQALGEEEERKVVEGLP